MNKGQAEISESDLGDRLHAGAAAWFVLMVSLLLTLAGWMIANAYVERRANDRFDFEVTSTLEAIAKRMQEYEQVLRGGVGLFKASTEVSRQEWNEYVSTLLIDTYWPGIQGIGYAQMLKPSEISTHEQSIQAQGFPDYRVNPVGEREIYSAIVFLEPFSGRNMRAFGYDMYSNPVRREAMQRAADSGEPALSGRVTLVQETDRDIQAGFLVYLPVYRSGMPLHTIEERRAALQGFVYSPFRVNDLLEGILGKGAPALDYQIYDDDKIEHESLLYDSRKVFPIEQKPGQFSDSRSLALQGRNWRMTFHSSLAFDESMDSFQPTLVAAGGLLVDTLLFVVILSMTRQRRAAMRHTQQLSKTLSDLGFSERLLKRTAEVARVGSWQLDLHSGELRWAEEAYQICGLVPGSPIDLERFLAMLHPNDRARFDAAWQAGLLGKPFDLEHRLLLHDRQIWVQARAEFQFDSQRRPYAVLGSMQDITDRKQSEQALRLSSRVIEVAREGIMVTDAGVRLIDVNPMFTKITGYERHEVLGRKPSLLASGRHDKAFYQAMWEQISESGGWQGEIWNRAKNGELFLERISIAVVTDPDSDEVINYVGMISDATEAHLQKERLEYLAHHDVLTGLPNRYLLTDRLEMAIAQANRRNSHLALAFIDLDGFKPINDECGHAVGDKTLVEVAKRLRSVLRDEDTVARLGGDEFALLYAAGTDIDQAQGFLDRLLKRLNEPYLFGERVLHMTASVGVAFYPNDAREAEQLLLMADKAMYQAKHAGGGRFSYAGQVDREADR